MTEDRAPCPFCGNASVQLTSIRDGYEAWCKCGASMTASNPDSRNKVIAKWNARTLASPSDDLRAENERVRAALEAIEQACDDLAANRSQETYHSMVHCDRAKPYLEALDDARRDARALLRRAALKENRRG